MNDLCRSLRWKAILGVDRLDVAQLRVMYQTADAPFSCLATCQAWGPDDNVAAPELCQPGRGCFEPSKRLVRDTVA